MIFTGFHEWFVSWFDVGSYMIGVLMGAIFALFALRPIVRGERND